MLTVFISWNLLQVQGARKFQEQDQVPRNEKGNICLDKNSVSQNAISKIDFVWHPWSGAEALGIVLGCTGIVLHSLLLGPHTGITAILNFVISL